jgi:hypothetical protein
MRRFKGYIDGWGSLPHNTMEDNGVGKNGLEQPVSAGQAAQPPLGTTSRDPVFGCL